MPRGPGGVPLGADRPEEPARIKALSSGQRSSPLLPGEAAPASATPPQPISLPPHNFPPTEGAQAVYQLGTSVGVAGPGVAWVVPAALPYIVDQSHVCVVRGLGLAISNMLATTDVTAQLRFAAASVGPKFRIPPQPVAYVEREWATYPFVAGPGTKIDILVTVNDAGFYPLSAYFEGWIMLVDDWARYNGAR